MRKWSFRLMMAFVAVAIAACQPQQVKESNSSIQGAEKSPADVYVSLGVEYMNRGMNEVALEKLKERLTSILFQVMPITFLQYFMIG
jgi:type IV pilus assembly protein PilF